MSCYDRLVTAIKSGDVRMEPGFQDDRLVEVSAVPHTPPRAPSQMPWGAKPGWSFLHRVDLRNGRVLCTGEAVDMGDMELDADLRRCNDCLAAKGRSAL